MAQTTGPLNLSDYISTATDRAYKNWGRGDEMFDWAKTQFEKNQATSDKVVNQALDTGRTTMDWAKTDRNMYETEYMPAMKEQLDYARGYTTPERMAANRGSAIAGSNITFDAAADMAKRALMGYGVDPSAGRFAGLDAGLAAKRAASAAGVGTKSDRDTEMMGQQLLANAIRTGQVLPGQAVNEAGVSLAAGNQAINTGLATTASGAQTMGTPVQWTGMGDDMIKEWKDAMTRQTDAGLKANQQQIDRDKVAQSSSSGLGAALGAGAGILGMVGNFAMPGGGSLGGSLLGGLMGAAKKGGLVKKMAKGGPVKDAEFEEFDPEGEGYDYKTAAEAGIERDAEGHMASRDPRSGMLLKGRKHPTFDKGVDEDRRLGYGLEKQEGRYYTQPFQRFEEGGEVGAMVNSIWGEGAPPEPMAFAEGGEVPEDDDMFVDTPEEGMEGMGMGMGGEEEVPNLVTPEMSPSGGQQTDDVHALLNEGEFVIPKEVTSWYGEKYFQNLIQKAYKEKQAAQANPEAATPQQTEAVAMSAPTFESMGA